MGIVFYTDNLLRPDIAEACQRQLLRAINGHYLLSVSLRPLDFGDNFVMGLERGVLTMFKQILMGVSNVQTDVCFLAEHDVLYSRGYFEDFLPPHDDRIYYNENLWRVSAETGHALFRRAKTVSQLCAYTQVLIDHYGTRVARIEKDGFTRGIGYEPGTRRASFGGIDDLRSETWFSAAPNIDIRDTGNNLTASVWDRSKFRNQKFTRDWTESGSVPVWGKTLGRFDEFLREIRDAEF